ncbi:hypothetical protein GIB67_031965 [Kingdonia uniflora]|uniref:NPH3 domain-containing protein n=1 Tax=Kingdonia uniflora TaxID=39325 RepID=A0A7J7NTM7_9MAGN|nr:hypothetical protein GIB67_031965 [Kingdonia uniflora]
MEIAQDVNLPLVKLIALAEAIPDFARIEHDYLYKAIDIYLKRHDIIKKRIDPHGDGMETKQDGIDTP